MTTGRRDDAGERGPTGRGARARAGAAGPGPAAPPLTYGAAGVDLDAQAAWVRRLGARLDSTAFAGGFEFAGRRLVAGTDSVGSKVLLGAEAGRLSGLGIDCVAMNVNDVLTCGAAPLFFLDYLAVDRLRPEVASALLDGIAEGCRQAGCVLLGGETAQIPDLYGPGRFDLAGFCVGAVEAPPRPQAMQEGDLLVGLPSSGLHSNGFALVRRLLAADPDGAPPPEVLLTPTRIYVRSVLEALREGAAVSAMAHVTGGGLPGNLTRGFPAGLGARLQVGTWPEPAVFAWLRRHLPEAEMRRVFNLGIGFVLVARPREAEALARGLGGHLVGEVVAGEGVAWAGRAGPA